jgi:DNA-binding response OmpR family regulator
MKPIQVLVIDDDVLFQKFASLALTDRGIEVFGAYDTSEADKIMERAKIDVIVCDVQMSPETGLDYCNRLRYRHIRTPIILMSGYASPVAMQSGVKSSADAYLLKPFAIDQIYQRILEVLAAHTRTPVNASNN